MPTHGVGLPVVASGRPAVVRHSTGEGDLVLDRVGEHAVDQDLTGRVVGHRDLVLDDARVDDRSDRLELRRDAGAHDHPLLLRLTTTEALRDVLCDLQHLDLASVAARSVVGAVDVVEDQKRRHGTNDHGCDQDQRSTRAHTHLVPRTNMNPRGAVVNATTSRLPTRHLGTFSPRILQHRRCRGTSTRGTTRMAPQPSDRLVAPGN